MIPENAIPQDKTEAVFRAIRTAFHATVIEDITTLPKGLSSDLTFRIVVRGSPFLLKIMSRIDERNDPVRIFTAMTAAAEAGLAPLVKYASFEDGISITDFVETAPLSVIEALERIPDTLQRLHALPPFPKAFNFQTAHNFFIWRFRNAGLVSANEALETFVRYEQICAVYPRVEADMVSCHCDLKPENILFDGERLWLVDWQAAFRNDRYFDLAVAANFLLASEKDETTYLRSYFGQAPDEYQRARFFLMRQVLHMFYAGVFSILGSGGAPADPGEKLPRFHDFHSQIWAGEVNLADNRLKIAYGRVHWEQLVQNVRGDRFADALATVSARHSVGEGFTRLLPAAP